MLGKGLESLMPSGQGRSGDYNNGQNNNRNPQYPVPNASDNNYLNYGNAGFASPHDNFPQNDPPIDPYHYPPYNNHPAPAPVYSAPVPPPYPVGGMQSLTHGDNAGQNSNNEPAIPANQNYNNEPIYSAPPLPPVPPDYPSYPAYSAPSDYYNSLPAGHSAHPANDELAVIPDWVPMIEAPSSPLPAPYFSAPLPSPYPENVPPSSVSADHASDDYNAIRHHEADYSTVHGTVDQVLVDRIFPNPHQPRRYFDEASLSELASSIREFGVIQPLVVTKISKDLGRGIEEVYQLIAGERRLKASRIAGLRTVPVIVKNVAVDRERLELAIIENIQRENLNPLEAARSYARLQDEFGLTQREIAVRMGKSRETIANTLRLLNLPSDIQNALENGRINESHARILLQIGDTSKQTELFNTILDNKPSVRELKASLKRAKSYERSDGSASAAFADLEVMELARRLENSLGTKVEISNQGDRGKIMISYYSPEELHGLIGRLGLNREDMV